MLAASLPYILLLAIAGISILLMLLRPRGISEVWWIGGGAFLLIVFQLVSLKLAAKAIAEGLDVYLFLTGMMLLSELAREHGVFDWLSSAAITAANGSCTRLFTLVYGIGTLVTIFMSNDATAVVLTPAILFAIRKAKVPPLPYLFACALIANAASFVLPISNPANLVVFRQDMPPLESWIVSFGLPSILSIAATYLILRVIFRKELTGSTEDGIAAPLTQDGKLVLAGLALTVVILLIASSMNKDLGLPTCLAALAITAILSIRTRSNPWRLAKEISWSTIALVAGLFILVNAVQSIGALQFTQTALVSIEHLSPAYGAMMTGFAVGIANNLINNLPLGLIAGSTLQTAHATRLISNAVLIGVDLGPNLSVTGSLATILWLIALRKEKLHVTAWSFLKIGVIAMPLALFAALSGTILMQWLIAR